MAHKGRNDVTEIPTKAGSSKARNSILDVEQSNSFSALEGMVDQEAAESRASAQYTCNQPHGPNRLSGRFSPGLSGARPCPLRMFDR
jgi:hypothetical protein